MKQSDVVAKAILCKRDGSILLLRRASTDQHRPGEWDLPGGGVDPNEDFAAAVSREIYEEAGIQIDRQELRLSYAQTVVISNDNVCYLVYIGQIQDLAIRLSLEHDTYQWTSVDTAMKMSISSRQQKALRYLKTHQLLAS